MTKPRRWLPVPRATRRRIARIARTLLCALLAFAMMPGAEGVVTEVAHLLHDGHLPHSAAHAEVAATEVCAGDCQEHGCTPLAHVCHCCGSQSGLALRGAAAPWFARTTREETFGAHPERGPPSAGVEPALRPPIT